MTRPHDFATAYAGRLLQDAWIDASSRYWLRRAQEFENARPRAGDFPGTNPDPEGRRAAADQRLSAIAEACRNRAAYLDASNAEYLETLEIVATRTGAAA